MIGKATGAPVLYASPDDVTELREEDTAVQAFTGWVVAAETSSDNELPDHLSGFQPTTPSGEDDQEEDDGSDISSVPTAQVYVPDVFRYGVSATELNATELNATDGTAQLLPSSKPSWRYEAIRAGGRLTADRSVSFGWPQHQGPKETGSTVRSLPDGITGAPGSSTDQVANQVQRVLQGYAPTPWLHTAETALAHAEQHANALTMNSNEAFQAVQHGAQHSADDREGGDAERSMEAPVGESSDTQGGDAEERGQAFEDTLEAMNRAFELSGLDDDVDLAGFQPVSSEPGLYEVRHPALGLIRVRFEEGAGRRGLHLEVESLEAVKAIGTVQWDLRTSLREQGFELLSVSAPEHREQTEPTSGGLELEA